MGGCRGFIAGSILIGVIASAWGQPAAEPQPTPPPPAEVAGDTAEPSLSLGDPAPPIVVSRWVQGEPVERFEPGTVYVIDFWASWWGPCRESTRMLNRLQIGWQDRVRVVGIASANEARRETLGSVQRFIEGQGSAMRYTVGFDEPRVMFRAYMTGSGVSGIPRVFVVDQAGRLAWHGHPQDPQFPSVVALVLEGAWSIEAYERLVAEQRRADALMAEAVAAWDEEDRERTVEILQRIFEMNPGRFGQHAVWKFHALHAEMGESDRAYDYAWALIEGELADQPDLLADLAWSILEAPPERRYDDIVAEMAARRALQVTDRQHGHAWGAMAWIEARRQNFDESLAAWEQALSLADNDAVEGVYRLRRDETVRARDEALGGR